MFYGSAFIDHIRNKLLAEDEKKQKQIREEIYLKAADLIESNQEEYCCDALAHALYKTCGWGLRDGEELFPEFFRLAPRDYKSRAGWWKIGDKKVRTVALILAAEMCK